MTEKLKVGIVGGTGMVGQRFVQLLDQHPWFKITAIAASANSAGKTYEESVQGRWKLSGPIPEDVKNIVIQDASKVEEVAAGVDFIFCAVDMKKNEIQALEEAYAKTGPPVISNNSAHRWTPDIPMVIPEINPGHIEVIAAQRKRLGTSTGFIAVKPNCSIQSYVPALHALLDYKPTKVVV
jgi:aspartate-semialdehyde dehydrogenase